MAASDNIIYVNTSSARTLTLPAPTNGRLLTIKDSTGSASTNNITINPHASETIDGVSSVTINVNYGEIQFQSDGTNWFTNVQPNLGYISFSLTASTTAVASQLTFDTRNIKAEIINYSIFNGTDRRVGTLKVVGNNAIGSASTVVSLIDKDTETSDIVVGWTAAMSSNNCQLSYTTGSGTFTMDAYITTFRH